MAFRVIGHFLAKSKIVHLWHERLMIGVQCQLGFVGDLFSYQKVPFENFCDLPFCSKLRHHEFFSVCHCTFCTWVERSKFI